MFEPVPWDEASDGPEPVPPVDLDMFDDVAFTDADLEALVAGDPERPRTVTEILAEAERGPIDAALAAELAAIDVSGLNDDQRIAVAVAAGRCVNHFEGVKLRAVGAFAGPEPRDDVSEGAFAWSEVAGALRLGEGQARTLTHNGRRLRTHLRGTLAGMLAGDVSLGKAQTLISATDGLDVDQCAWVEELTLPHAGTRNPSNHSAAVGRAVRKVDPDGWKHRREDKLRDIALIRLSHGDGVADMLLRSLDSVETEMLWTSCDTWARQQKAVGDPRTLDALRVHAILHWAACFMTGTPITRADLDIADTPDRTDDTQSQGDAQPQGDVQPQDDAQSQDDVQPPAARPGRPPMRNGQLVTVNVMINLPDLIDPGHGGAAAVAGSGEPLPAEAVAELLRDGARIRFVLVDNDGNLAGISTKLHDPTALMRVFVALRDVTLRVPGGSTTVVAGQDLDHIDPNGLTEPANLHAPSRGWHRAKTFGHWVLTANSDGSITWTSRRTGRAYTTRPYNHRDDP